MWCRDSESGKRFKKERGWRLRPRLLRGPVTQEQGGGLTLGKSFGDPERRGLGAGASLKWVKNTRELFFKKTARCFFLIQTTMYV